VGQQNHQHHGKGRVNMGFSPLPRVDVYVTLRAVDRRIASR
jgi:hypothetical protein